MGVTLDPESGEFRSCSCAAKAVLEYRLDRANVKRRYRGFGWKSLHGEFRAVNQKQLAKVEDFVDTLDQRIRTGGGLYIQGPPGVAKSAITALLIREACERNYSAYVIRLSALVNLRIESLRDMAKRNRVERILRSRLLALEEIDKVAVLMDESVPGKMRNEAIQELMSEVYDNDCALIATANCPIEVPPAEKSRGVQTLSDLFPDHIVDRLRSLVPVTLEGESFREHERWR